MADDIDRLTKLHGAMVFAFMRTIDGLLDALEAMEKLSSAQKRDVYEVIVARLRDSWPPDAEADVAAIEAIAEGFQTRARPRPKPRSRI